ncbi:MAG: hypothetical protein ACXWAT_12585 [Methylobacter sp.]
MKLKRLIAAFFILALNFAIIGHAYSDPIIFAQVNNPAGIVVDNTGSVFVQSLSLPEFGGGGLLKFDANGNLMAQNNQLTGNFRLALDSVRNIIWAQEMNGFLYSIDPDTLLAQPVVDLRAWIMSNILQSQAFNILTGMPDTLVMVNPVFGDIATAIWPRSTGCPGYRINECQRRNAVCTAPELYKRNAAKPANCSYQPTVSGSFTAAARHCSFRTRHQ